MLSHHIVSEYQFAVKFYVPSCAVHEPDTLHISFQAITALMTYEQDMLHEQYLSQFAPLGRIKMKIPYAHFFQFK